MTFLFSCIHSSDICPFCCKVKAFLDWKKIPYSAVDVNPITKAEIAFSKDYRKVPISMSLCQLRTIFVVVQNGKQVNDSSVIISELLGMNQAAAESPQADPAISKWLEFVDKKLAVLLFPNITRNFLESWEAFGYINEVPHFSAVQKLGLRISGSLAMRLANSKIKKKYAIEDERVALLDAIRTWTKDGLKGRKFHGGEKPDLADVCVYGCLRSIEKFQTFAWLLDEGEKELLIWFNRMAQEIGESSCVSRE